MQGRNSCGRKLGHLNTHVETVKIRMGSTTGNADKKSTKTGQNGKTKRSWSMREENGNDNTRKITIQLEKKPQKVLAKKGD